MAHKKGVGSSKNGRESASQRLGIKFSVVRRLLPATSSCVSAAPSTTLATMWVLAKTTRSMHWLMEQ